MFRHKDVEEVITIQEFIVVFVFFIFVVVTLFQPSEVLKQRILAEKSNYDLSVAYLQNFVRLSPENEYLIYQMAKRTLQAKKTALASKLIELLYHSKDPKLKEKALYLGYELNKLIYVSTDDEKLKKEYLKKSLQTLKFIFDNEFYTKDPVHWYREAVFFDQKELEIKALEYVYQKKPSLKLLKQLYYLSVLVKDNQRSLKYLDELIQKDKENRLKWLEAAYYLASNIKNDKLSFEYLKELEKIDKKHRLKWVLVEYYAYMNKKDYKNAEKVLLRNQRYYKVRKILPDFYTYTRQYNKVYKLYYDLFKRTKKTTYFKKMIQVLIQEKNYNKAISILKRYENHFIYSKKMREFIIKSYLSINRVDLANNYAQKIVKVLYR